MLKLITNFVRVLEFKMLLVYNLMFFNWNHSVVCGVRSKSCSFVCHWSALAFSCQPRPLAPPPWACLRASGLLLPIVFPPASAAASSSLPSQPKQLSLNRQLFLNSPMVRSNTWLAVSPRQTSFMYHNVYLDRKACPKNAVALCAKRLLHKYRHLWWFGP